MSFLFNVALCLINAASMVYLYILFFSSFDNYRFKRSTSFWLSLAIIVLFTLLLLFVGIPTLKFSLFTLLTILTSLLIKLSWYKALLLSGIAYALVMVSEAFITFLLSFVFSISNQQAVAGPFFIIGLLLSKALLFFLFLIIRNFAKKSPSKSSWKKTLIVLIIPTSTIAVMILQYKYFMKMQEYSSTDTLLTLICFSFLLASNFIVFELINQIYKDHEKDKQITVANKLIRSQNDNYQQLLQHNRDIQKIRHDHRNFLIGVLSDLKDNNIEKLQAELELEFQKLDEISNIEKNLNIIDYIVGVKTNWALKDNIKINYTSSNLNSVQVSSIDLSIIIGNALDNAIEAVSKLNERFEKEISVLVKHHQNNIIIVIKNKFEGALDVNRLATTKSDSQNHGFGIPEIKQIAAKYSGIVEIMCEDQTFELRIVLRNSYNE